MLPPLRLLPLKLLLELLELLREGWWIVELVERVLVLVERAVVPALLVERVAVLVLVLRVG